MSLKSDNVSQHYPKDLAAYILGNCYKRGVDGFKLDTKKADKWLSKVESSPFHANMFDEVTDHLAENETPIDEVHAEGIRVSGSSLLFPEGLSVSGESHSEELWSSSKPYMANHDVNENYAVGGNGLDIDIFSLPSLSGTSNDASSKSGCKKCTACQNEVTNQSDTLCGRCKIPGRGGSHQTRSFRH